MDSCSLEELLALDGSERSECLFCTYFLSVGVPTRFQVLAVSCLLHGSWWRPCDYSPWRSQSFARSLFVWRHLRCYIRLCMVRVDSRHIACPVHLNCLVEASWILIRVLRSVASDAAPRDLPYLRYISSEVTTVDGAYLSVQSFLRVGFAFFHQERDERVFPKH